jgi:hypothetical protein
MENGVARHDRSAAGDEEVASDEVDGGEHRPDDEHDHQTELCGD